MQMPRGALSAQRQRDRLSHTHTEPHSARAAQRATHKEPLISEEPHREHTQPHSATLSRTSARATHREPHSAKSHTQSCTQPLSHTQSQAQPRATHRATYSHSATCSARTAAHSHSGHGSASRASPIHRTCDRRRRASGCTPRTSSRPCGRAARGSAVPLAHICRGRGDEASGHWHCRSVDLRCAERSAPWPQRQGHVPDAQVRRGGWWRDVLAAWLVCKGVKSRNNKQTKNKQTNKQTKLQATINQTTGGQRQCTHHLPPPRVVASIFILILRTLLFLPHPIDARPAGTNGAAGTITPAAAAVLADPAHVHALEPQADQEAKRAKHDDGRDGSAPAAYPTVAGVAASAVPVSRRL